MTASVDPASWGCTCKNDGVRLVKAHYACPFHGNEHDAKRIEAIKSILRMANMSARDRIAMALAALDAW